MTAIRHFVSFIALLLAASLTLGLALGGHADAGSVSCSPNHPSACLYTSDLSYDVGIVDGIEAVDPNRHSYRVPLLVRYPIGADGPRPVVIWHHGGDPREDGKNDSVDWGNLLARAGYVVIHPSRVLPDSPLAPDEVDACADSGFGTDESSCQYWLANYRYGAVTTEFLIRRLDDLEAADPALTGLFDHDTIAVAGFSAGTTSVHVNAGAWQQWDAGSQRYHEPVRGPVAFFAAGPQGPEYAGFNSGFQSRDGDAEDGTGWDEHSWVGIERPYMFVTGVGDETNEPPESRVAGFLTSVGNDNKFLLWDTEPTAVHNTMNINKCDTDIRADHCEWIASAGLAYFDLTLRGRREARRWLASDALDILTADAIELYRR